MESSLCSLTRLLCPYHGLLSQCSLFCPKPVSLLLVLELSRWFLFLACKMLEMPGQLQVLPLTLRAEQIFPPCVSYK